MTPSRWSARTSRDGCPGHCPVSGTKTRTDYLGVGDRIQAGFPEGVTFTVVATTAGGAWVAAEVVSLGKHINGKTYNNHYHFLFVIRDGLIVAVKEYMDTLRLHQLIS